MEKLSSVGKFHGVYLDENLVMKFLGSAPKNTTIFDVGGRGLAAAPIAARTHVAACPQRGKPTLRRSPIGNPRPPKDLQIRSSCKECELKEGKEAIAREIAERNRRNGWPY
jgi:hypothetical protein